MRRAIVLIAVLLLAGAVVNVAVAWGCLLFPETFAARFYQGNDSAVVAASSDEIESVRKAFRATQFRDDQCLSSGTSRLGWTMREAEVLPRLRRPSSLGANSVVDVPRLNHLVAGLPFKSLEGVRSETIGQVNRSGALPVPSFLGSSEPLASMSMMPILPLWPGFAINTVFYAAILWALFAAPFALRRRRRIKRGLCRHCGYDLRGRAADAHFCPECGASA
jgi:hypothetical protein